MISLESQKEIPKFLNLLAQKKRTFEQHSYLHISIHSQELKVSELAQAISFQFPSQDTITLQLPETRELYLVTKNDTNQSLSAIDRSVYENFTREEVRATTNVFKESSIHEFERFMSASIAEEDRVSKISLRRLTRMTNTLLVLDDDSLVLKKAEEMLQVFGAVIAINDPDLLLERYEQYAPNVLFLDIHLPGSRGPELMEKIKTEVDPHAYVVMISSDSQLGTVQECLKKGAASYVVKPLHADLMYKSLLKAPTFNPKKS